VPDWERAHVLRLLCMEHWHVLATCMWLKKGFTNTSRAANIRPITESKAEPRASEATASRRVACPRFVTTTTGRRRAGGKTTALYQHQPNKTPRHHAVWILLPEHNSTLPSWISPGERQPGTQPASRQKAPHFTTTPTDERSPFTSRRSRTRGERHSHQKNTGVRSKLRRNGMTTLMRCALFIRSCSRV
jgi:hypothetical protein